MHIIWLQSQKQSAHWAVNATAQVVLCWLGSWLRSWLVKCSWLRSWFFCYVPLSRLYVTWISCIKTVNSGDIQSCEQNITENNLSQLHLNTWVFPEFHQPSQLNIDRKLTEMMIYSEVSCFFWECRCHRCHIDLGLFHLKWRVEI